MPDSVVRFVHKAAPPLVVLESGSAPAPKLSVAPRQLAVAVGGRIVLPKALPRPAEAAPAPPPTGPALLQRVFRHPRYRLEKLLGEGGNGFVFRARDTLLNFDVALKFLPEWTKLKPETVELFKREAVTCMRLSHENIVKVFNLEIAGRHVFIVMEFVDGENLRQVMQRMGRLTLRSVVSIARSCVSALDYAHREGVLKVVDFGIARARAAGAAGTGFIEGTPGYMSPEQIRAETPDERADLHALGAILCELLTGEPVFRAGKDVSDWLRQEVPAVLAMPDPVAAVLRKCLARDREQRWTTAREFHEALKAACG
jgi:serine/threonine-protein kinase